MPWLRRARRLSAVALHLLVGAVLALALFGGPAPRQAARRQAVLRAWQARLCRLLGVELRVSGRPHPGPALLVCNHVSWLDIPVLGAVVPGHFLAKAELRSWPFLGWLAARAGTLFVARGERGAMDRAVMEMVWILRRGAPVVAFPEGTTTDGTRVRRFHGPMFEAAILAAVPVQPVALRFQDAHGEPAAAVPFLGDDAFVPHLLRLAGLPGVVAEVAFLDPIPGRAGERAALAAAARAAVRERIEDPAARALAR
jgi:1-acyl-sn-glycerol-3-phosphate acyltransferase